MHVRVQMLKPRANDVLLFYDIAQSYVSASLWSLAMSHSLMRGISAQLGSAATGCGILASFLGWLSNRFCICEMQAEFLKEFETRAQATLLSPDPSRAPQ